MHFFQGAGERTTGGVYVKRCIDDIYREKRGWGRLEVGETFDMFPPFLGLFNLFIDHGYVSLITLDPSII